VLVSLGVKPVEVRVVRTRNHGVGSGEVAENQGRDEARGAEISDLLEVVKHAVRYVTGGILDHGSEGESSDNDEDEDEDGDDFITNTTELESVGVTSIGVVMFCSQLCSLLRGLDVPATAPIVYPNVMAFATYLRDERHVSAGSIDRRRIPSLSRMQQHSSPSLEKNRADGFISTALNRRDGETAKEKATSKKQSRSVRATHQKTTAPDQGLEACRTGNLALLLELLNPALGAGTTEPNPLSSKKARWDVETVDRFGSPGLHWAASGGHLELCKVLVEYGADPHKRDKKSGRSALHWAARQVRGGGANKC
jgi:hypothetical protein